MTDVSLTPGEPDAAGAGIDTTVSHSARIWDYWLKGTDNYAVDREVGDRIEEMRRSQAMIRYQPLNSVWTPRD